MYRHNAELHQNTELHQHTCCWASLRHMQTFIVTPKTKPGI